jgi:phosphatidylinositol kinase/protein kinase (PI-3  family)
MPCSPLKAKLIACFMLVPCLACSSALKMQMTSSSKTLADFQWTTWRYIPEKRELIKKNVPSKC